MRINNNIMSMNANRQLGVNTLNQSKSLEKLSSGKRINRAADDAAGLAISEKMRGQIRGLQQSVRNAQDGISFLQTAEGALDEVSNMLNRMKELAVEKANQTYTASDTNKIDLELTQLGSKITDILSTTKFNGNGIKTAINVAVKGDDTSLTSIGYAITGLDSLGSSSKVDNIDAAMESLNTARANFGAQQNALESIVNNLNTTVENLQAAESRIRDTDMAGEMAKFNTQNILVNSAVSMLAQANAAPQSVLKLLG